MSQWFKFFLVRIIETAKSGIETLDGILQLQKVIDFKIQSLGSRANNAQKVVQSLYQRPVTDASKVAEITGLSSASSYKLIASLEQLDILLEVTGGQRGKFYIFKDYLGLFTERKLR